MRATRTGLWLGGLGIGALWTSPMRRARETAECIAAVTELAVQADDRLRERLNWDGSMPWEAFADSWARTAEDRDLVPVGGPSARQAGVRLQSFLAGLRGVPGPVAAVTHGGVTTELLRTLLRDDALPPGALSVAGIPPCAITTMDDLNSVMIASVSHLRWTPLTSDAAQTHRTCQRQVRMPLAGRGLGDKSRSRVTSGPLTFRDRGK